MCYANKCLRNISVTQGSPYTTYTFDAGQVVHVLGDQTWIITHKEFGSWEWSHDQVCLPQVKISTDKSLLKEAMLRSEDQEVGKKLLTIYNSSLPTEPALISESCTL